MVVHFWNSFRGRNSFRGSDDRYNDQTPLVNIVSLAIPAGVAMLIIVGCLLWMR
jgi:hypothetical protein